MSAVSDNAKYKLLTNFTKDALEPIWAAATVVGLKDCRWSRKAYDPQGRRLPDNYYSVYIPSDTDTRTQNLFWQVFLQLGAHHDTVQER